MTIRTHVLRMVPATLALIGSLCAVAPNAQAAPPVFTKTVTSLITPTSAAPIALRTGSLALADFNGDGGIDAAVPGVIIAGVAVLLNDGNGSAGLTWFDAGRTPTALATGDFDNDGDIDLAAALKGEGGAAFLTNDGTGQFERIALYETGLGPTAVATVEINQDNLIDLAVANRGDGSVSVLINTVDGFFVLQKIPLPAVLPTGVPAVSSQPNALTVADLDGDGLQDVAVACAGDDSVKVLYNIEGRLVLGGTYAAGPCPVAVMAANLNADGRADLVVADYESPQATVLLQDAMGQFIPQDLFLVSVPYGAFNGPTDLLLLDLDGNWSPDLRVSGCSLYNTGSGGFGAPQYQASAAGFYSLARLPGHRGTFLGTAASGSVSISYVPDAWVIGDVNNDRVVNVMDLAAIVTAWAGQKTPPTPNYDPNADLNEDGYVNIGDLQMLIAHWGEQH